MQVQCYTLKRDDDSMLVIGGKKYDLGRPLIMGILNVTPDSFYDGGEFDDAVSAVDHAVDMAAVIADTGCTVVLMHMQGIPRTMQQEPSYDNVVEEIIDFLKERVAYAVDWGIQKEKIIVDPGIGFGKTLPHNLAILSEVERFRETGCPVLIGASRKSMIGRITGAPVDDRLWGTAAITAHCTMKGVAIHRVHDVREMRRVCDVAQAIRDGFVIGAGG